MNDLVSSFTGVKHVGTLTAIPPVILGGLKLYEAAQTVSKTVSSVNDKGHPYKLIAARQAHCTVAYLSNNEKDKMAAARAANESELHDLELTIERNDASLRNHQFSLEKNIKRAKGKEDQVQNTISSIFKLRSQMIDLSSLIRTYRKEGKLKDANVAQAKREAKKILGKFDPLVLEAKSYRLNSPAFSVLVDGVRGATERKLPLRILWHT